MTDKKLRVIDDKTGKSHEHVWAIGDASVIEDERLPATAQVASQKAHVCALKLDPTRSRRVYSSLVCSYR